MKTPLPNFSNIDSSKIVVQLKTLLDQNRQTLKELLSSPAPFTWDNLLRPLEDMDDRLHHFWSPVAHLNSVLNSAPLRGAYNEAIPLLTDYQIEIGQNQKFFEAVQSIAANQNQENLGQAQKMILKHMLRDFKLAGVALSTEKKLSFAELSNKLAKLFTQFEENVLDATEGWVKHIVDERELLGVPDLALKAAQELAQKRNLNGWVFTLEAPSYFAIMMHAHSCALREEMYRAFVTRASDQGPNAGKWDNSEIMQQILTYRLERAKLLGFESYAHESLATKMVKTPQAVLEFLNKLSVAARDKAHQELDELAQFAKAEDSLLKLQPWDLGYYSEKLRQQRYFLSQEELRNYFPIEKVLTGLFAITERLFGLTMQQVVQVDVWHKDVTCYAIYDQNKQLRSYFYIDLYARTNKRGGAWMDEYCVRRRLTDGSIQHPVAFVNCNFQSPVEGIPALLTHDEVVTLFHEFGHSLQHMLTLMDYSGVSGINGIPWDAVEVASQFLENWTWEQTALNKLAEHYPTHEPLPTELFEKLNKAKNFQKAMQMMRQLELALFDFEVHLKFDPQKTNQIQDILDQVRAQTALLPAPPFNRFQHGFTHIFGGGYAAGYYSYKWAEVMANDAFALFKEQGIFDASTSEKFLHTFLEQGGSVDPLDLFIEFRGRPPKIEALLQHEGILPIDNASS